MANLSSIGLLPLYLSTITIILLLTICVNQLLIFCYQVVGTRGYAAPEYIETGHLRLKSDIWSFGVVLYEILTGRRVLETKLPPEEQKLLQWVKTYPAESSRFSMIMDPRLAKQYSLDAARRIAKLADSCLKKNPEDRPSMSQIVESLKRALQLSETSNSTQNMITFQSPRSKLTQKVK